MLISVLIFQQILLAPMMAFAAYSHTISIDGTNDFNSSGTTNESFTTSTSGYSMSVSWDSTNVYIGVTGTEVNSSTDAGYKWVQFYFGGTGGTTNGLSYNHQKPALPFNAKYHLRWKSNGTYTNMQTWNGSTWATSTWSGTVSKSGTFVEFKIPRSDIGSPNILQLNALMMNEKAGSEWTWSVLPGNAFTDAYSTAPTFSKFYAFDLGADSASTRQASSNFAYSSYSYNTASFSFAAAAGASSVGVDVSTDQGATWSSATLSSALSASSTSATVTGLTSLTAYAFRLTVSGGSNEGTSTIVQFTTTASPTTAYTHAITIDGTNDFNASGTSAENFSSSSSGYNAYVTWDSTYVYVGYSGTDVNANSASKWVQMYFGGSAGTTNGQTYVTQQPAMSFAAQYHLRWKTNGSYTDIQSWNGSTWSSTTWSGSVSKSGTFVEFKIPRASIGNPKSLQMVVMMVNETVGSEWTWGISPSTAFTDAKDPNITSNFEFDLSSAKSSSIQQAYLFAATSTQTTGNAASFTFAAPTGATSVKIQQSSNNGTSWSDATTSSALSATSSAAKVTGLSPSSTYLFRLVIVGGSLEGSSAIVRLTTAASSPVANFAMTTKNTSSNPYSASFSWVAATSATAVTIEQSEDGGATWTASTTSSALSASSTTGTVTGLKLGTSYQFRLYAVGGTKSGISNAVSVSMYTAITSFVVTSKSDSSVVVSWGAITGATSIIVQQSPESLGSWSVADTDAISTTATTATISGLNASTGYDFRLLVTGGASAGTSNTAWAYTKSPPLSLTLSSTSVSENVAVGTTVGTIQSTDPDAGDTATYSLVSGNGDTDNAKFTVVGTNLKTVSAIDFETQATFYIRLQVKDSDNLTYQATFVINTLNVNETPTDINLSSTSVVEGSALASTLGTITGADPDFGDTFTYSLVTGTGSADNASFVISTNKLKLAVIPDYETKAAYSIRIRATDTGGLYFEKMLVITVTNVNETPTDISLNTSAIDENVSTGTLVGSFSAVDPDGAGTVTYELVNGNGSSDNTKFAISGSDLRVIAPIDYESKPTLSIRVRATDAGNLYFEKIITITVNNLNEAPTSITLNNNMITENESSGTVIGTFSTYDVDSTSPFTYTLVDGQGSTDNASFTIDGSNLQSAAGFDYEANDTYSIRVRTSDSGGLYTEKVFVIEVQNENEAPSDMSISNTVVAENAGIGTNIGAFSAIDADEGDSFSYSFVNGTGDGENSQFQITGNVLTTNASFNYETNSSFSIRVQVTDSGGLSRVEMFTISVSNLNEAPTDLSLSSLIISENKPLGTVIGTVSSTDPDEGDTFQYTLVDGVDSDGNDSFQLIDNELRSKIMFDYEMQSQYKVRIRATDAAGLFFEKTLSISVTNINEEPSGIELDANHVNENVQLDSVIGHFSTTDPDSSDPFTYTLVQGEGGIDNSCFTISGTSLRASCSFDYENKTNYEIRVRTTDAGGMFLEQAFVIYIVNVNEAPTSLTMSDESIDENAADDAIVGEFRSEDPDSIAPFTYSLVSGVGDDDNALFSITDNKLLANHAFNFETKTTYTVRVQVADSDGLTLSRRFFINVNNLNETPTALGLTADTLQEKLVAGTVVGMLSTTDPDIGDYFSYHLVEGEGADDNGNFIIAGSELRTSVILDYEKQSTHSIRIRTEDAAGLGYEQVFTITILNVNEKPDNLILDDSTIDENVPSNTLVGTFSAVDPDPSDEITYKLVDGLGSDDNNMFVIVANQIKTKLPINYETDPSLSVRVRVTDIGGLFSEEIFTITVSNLNETPTDVSLSKSSIQENVSIGSVFGVFSTTDEDFGDSFTYSFVAGSGDTDNSAFLIVGSELRTNEAMDYEVQDAYSIRIRTTDSSELYWEEVLNLSVLNVNEVPSDISISANSINENTVAGTAIGSFSTTDIDQGDAFSYSLVSGSGATGNASFLMSGNQLITKTVFNYELQTSYSIRVRTTDRGGLTFDKIMLITVNNVNEYPTNILISKTFVAENVSQGTLVASLSTVDADDSDAFTYTLVSGLGSSDNATFSITDDQLQTADDLNFESKNTYSIRLRTTDSGELYFEKVVVILVTNVNEQPTDISISGTNVYENSSAITVVGKLSTTDPDIVDTFQYSLVSGVGGTDNGSFAISGTQLMTTAVFNYETKTTYNVRIRATDAGGLATEKTYEITILNQNERPVEINLTSTVISENLSAGTSMGNLSTVDPDADESFTYALISGASNTGNSSFTIAGNVLKTNTVFDYEKQTSYSIRMNVMDAGGLKLEKVFVLSVTNTNEQPSALTLSNNSIAENVISGTNIGMLSTTDIDSGDTFVYGFAEGIGGNDNNEFLIVGNVLKTKSAIDYESKASYSVRVRTTDFGGLYFEKVFEIKITDVNEGPTSLTLSTNTIAENVAVNSIVGAFNTVDQDRGQMMTYSLVAGLGNADNASFLFAGNVLKAKVSFNYEMKSVYTIRIRSADSGGLTIENIFTINVIDVNEAPSELILSKSVIAENSALGSSVGTLTTIDQDVSETLVYSLVGGNGSTDNSSFVISGNVLKTAVNVNYELKPTYSLRIRTTDAKGLFYDKIFAISVSDVNEIPTDLSLSSVVVNENVSLAKIVGNLSSTDEDRKDTFVYSLISGAGSVDNGNFSISGNVLKTNAKMNFEVADTHSIRVRTMDRSGLSFEKVIAINVNNINEAPYNALISNASIDENSGAGATIGTISGLDEDTTDTSFVYSLIAGVGSGDNAQFSLTGATLKSRINFNYEVRANYSIRVRVMDAGKLYVDKVLMIYVTDVNEAPSGMTLSDVEVEENAAVSTVVGLLSTVDPDKNETFTYSLSSGTGSSDNGSFSVFTNQIRTFAALNYEAKKTYSIRLKSTDSAGYSVEKVYLIKIKDVNEAPTNLTLSAITIKNYSIALTNIGLITAVDPDALDTFSYRVIGGSGSVDNGAIIINGNLLRIRNKPNMNSKSSYEIRIRGTDSKGLFFDKAFVITVTP